MSEPEAIGGPSAYRAFLEGKVPVTAASGIEIDPGEVNPALAPHCRAIVPWALKGGRRAVFAAFGLHKTSVQVEIMRILGRHVAGPRLIVLPLGVRHEFFAEAAERFTGDVATTLRFVRSDAEVDDEAPTYLTNYESIREGKLDPRRFVAASLDEAAVLRSYGSKTFQEFLLLFEAVRFKFVATATPSPNRTKELIHYAGFLGVMDTGQALTRFFQRNAESAGDLQLYPHKVDEFWLWVHSWAIFLQRPSDLGFSDDGYVLPPVEVRWHEVPSDYAAAGADRDGQGLLIPDRAIGVAAAAREKRASLPARIARMQALIAEDPEAHRILWHDLEDERRAIEVVVPGVRSIYGSQPLEVNEEIAIGFKEGRFRDLATKPEMSGAGNNFQAHCAWEIFLGIGFKFHDFIQAVHRIVRFGQTMACRIDIIYSESEREVRRILEGKWAEHDALMARMTEIIRRYGLGRLPVEEVLGRAIGIERRVAAGQWFEVANNDAVDEAARRPDGAAGLVVTSIPFSNHYEYVESYNDFGHTDDNAHFWRQMDFLTPELFRLLMPGRLACIHVKDRVLFGAVTGEGVPTISPFHAEAIFHYLGHGFQYLGMITIVTDVVRENNQTYRLGYTEMLKDGTKMGVGCPEYVLLFRRPQTDRSRGYADLPVVKDPAGYSLARWQVDAHAFWRSSGDRLASPAELAGLGAQRLAKFFTAWSLGETYDHDAHVAVGEAVEAARPGALPRTFMALAPGSHHPDVWHDVVRMKTLNGRQAARRVEKHICPLQFDIVDRLIDRYSNPGDLVYDPFGGLMTVPYRAILKGRRGGASELNATSFRDGVYYLEEAESGRLAPSLLDLLAGDAPEEEGEAAE